MAVTIAAACGCVTAKMAIPKSLASFAIFLLLVFLFFLTTAHLLMYIVLIHFFFVRLLPGVFNSHSFLSSSFVPIRTPAIRTYSRIAYSRNPSVGTSLASQNPESNASRHTYNSMTYILNCYHNVLITKCQVSLPI